MKVGVAQTQPIAGDIDHNIVAHCRLIELAFLAETDIIIFPELSITGYEPAMAIDLATHHDDTRFDIFQSISNSRDITIGIGVPTRYRNGIRISSVLFHPCKPTQIYSKMHLHADEEPFFLRGETSTGLLDGNSNVALAICYEISVPEHAANASRNGANFYIASVAKSVAGIEQALVRLSEIAREHSMTVFMSNCIGMCDGFQCGGKTSVWNNKGNLLSQLDDATEGIILFDTETQGVLPYAI